MSKREFNTWISSFRDSIADYGYYIDFEKIHRNIDQIKIELNILNSLIGSKNIEFDFDLGNIVPFVFVFYLRNEKNTAAGHAHTAVWQCTVRIFCLLRTHYCTYHQKYECRYHASGCSFGSLHSLIIPFFCPFVPKFHIRIF